MKLANLRAIALRAGSKVPDINYHPHGFKDHVDYMTALSYGGNVGIVINASGLWCVDVDVASGGSLEAVEEVFGQLPTTWESRTPGKNGIRGRHFYFRAPADAPFKARLAFLKGVDVNVNYLVAPPSQNANGLYEWVNHPNATPLADAPPGMIRALTQSIEPPSTSPSTTSTTELWLGAGAGRWNQLRKIAGTLRRLGLSAKTIEGCLNLIVENHCEYDETVSPAKIRQLAAFLKTKPTNIEPSDSFDKYYAKIRMKLGDDEVEVLSKHVLSFQQKGYKVVKK
jgi:hypothetical protein